MEQQDYTPKESAEYRFGIFGKIAGRIITRMQVQLDRWVDNHNVECRYDGVNYHEIRYSTGEEATSDEILNIVPSFSFARTAVPLSDDEFNVLREYAETLRAEESFPTDVNTV